MNLRSISFEPDALSFLLLNIVGHDPIHDFGEPSDTRWYQVSQHIDKIKPFLLAYDSYSGNDIVSGTKRSRVDDDLDDNETRKTRKKMGGFLFGKVRHGNMKDIRRDNVIKTLKNTHIKRDSLQSKNNVIVVENESTDDNHKTVLLEYIEHIKCQIVMNVFLNYINGKKINPSTAKFMSLYEVCYKVCVGGKNDSDYEIMRNLSSHLHDYIMDRFLLNTNENEKGVLILDAAMTFSKIIIRYSFVEVIPAMSEMSNTTILNSIKSNVTSLDIDNVFDRFFNSNHYFYISIGRSLTSSLSNETLSSAAVYGGDGSSVVADFDKKYDISAIRQTLLFIDAVFTCIDKPDTFKNTIDDLRKSMYLHTIASKGYSSPSKESQISLDELNGAITLKKNLEVINLVWTNQRKRNANRVKRTKCASNVSYKVKLASYKG
jgi:hypothetical protein